MKIGAIAAGIAFLALTLLSGCPKSNDMLDHSKKPGVIPTEGSAPPGELTTGAPPEGGVKAPPPPPAGDTSGGDTGGGDTGGGDDGGDDGGG